jgi:Fe-S cluster assembly iron-binding protein IscA
MALDEPKEDDEVVNNNGITYVINKALLEKVKPVSVDFVETAMGSGFSINSGLSQAGGCGSSCSC